MKKNRFSAYWAQVEYCQFKSSLVALPASRQLWNQLAEDWAELAQTQFLPVKERSLLPRAAEPEHSLAA
jgi:hypothetical protein